MRKDLNYLARKSRGHNLLDEEARNAGADSAIVIIVNLDKCADGIYEVRSCNHSYDYESGDIDGYDLELCPFVEEEIKQP